MNIVEKYSPMALAADSTTVVTGASSLHNFITTVSGTLSLIRADGAGILNAFPVTAGQVYFFDLRLDGGFTIILAGGARGTIGIAN